MGFLNRMQERRAERIGQSTKDAQKYRFMLDCTNSQRVIISLEKDLRALQRFAEKNDTDMVLHMAKKCYDNPLICCNADDLPYGGLIALQDVILSALRAQDSKFDTAPIDCLFSIALNDRLSPVFQACDEAKKILEIAETNA